MAKPTKDTDVSGNNLPNFDEWSEEQIGFAPYWKPAPGEWIYGMPVAVDMRDPKFIRYQFVAGKVTECRRGPSDEEDEFSEAVTVPVGGIFSMSVYHSLAPIFDEYLHYGAHSGKPVMVRIDAVKTIATKNQPKFWQFRARVSKQQMAELTAWRMKKLAGNKLPAAEVDKRLPAEA